MCHSIALWKLTRAFHHDRCVLFHTMYEYIGGHMHGAKNRFSKLFRPQGTIENAYRYGPLPPFLWQWTTGSRLMWGPSCLMMRARKPLECVFPAQRRNSGRYGARGNQGPSSQGSRLSSWLKPLECLLSWRDLVRAALRSQQPWKHWSFTCGLSPGRGREKYFCVSGLGAISHWGIKGTILC